MGLAAGEAAAPVRVLLADDDDAFLDSLRPLIEHQPELTVVGTAANGLGAIELGDEPGAPIQHPPRTALGTPLEASGPPARAAWPPARPRAGRRRGGRGGVHVAPPRHSEAPQPGRDSDQLRVLSESGAAGPAAHPPVQ